MNGCHPFPLMRFTLVRLALALAALAMLAGCATLDVDSGDPERLAAAERFYVEKLPADERGIEHVVAQELRAMNYDATSGPRRDALDNVDVLVTYQDRWAWDITMYMRRLDIQFRDPETREAWATGTAERGSLNRKQPGEFAREILEPMTGQSADSNASDE